MSDEPKRYHFIPSSILAALFSAAVVIFGVGAVYVLIRDSQHRQMELVSAFSKNNQEVTLLKVIDEKMTLPMETKVLLARTIVNMTTLKKIPLSLACGIIHVESKWDHRAASDAGAVGLWQVMPTTGKPHLRAERIDPTDEALLDPIANTIAGVGALADCRDFALKRGYDKGDSWGVTLAMYNGGPRVTKANGYSQAVLEAAKQYAALGL